uniref:MOSC domain-containing protein n=1 Tax=Lepeophtheirus salmonis TaxID=72036 RepID=A0A0K2UM59_LEPSM
MEELIDRATEFPQLSNETYLDHAGAGLFSVSQLDSAHKELSNNLFCNPHSSFDGKQEIRIRECRSKVLRYLKASPGIYHVVFTSGSTGSLKMIGDLFIRPNQELMFYYMNESHTSVTGLRELTNKSYCFRQEDMDKLDHSFFCSKTSLIAFPVMSNFCGKKFPIKQWIAKIREIETSLNGHKRIYIYLDAACYLSSNQLDLSLSHGMDVDFVCFSFYKIFGYPTGIGALVLKSECLDQALKVKKYFGGGAVQMNTVHERKKVLKMGVEGLEDGTLPYQQIFASIHGFNFIQNINIYRISQYTFSLAQKCYKELKMLFYSNGNPLILFNLSNNFLDPRTQGPIINFNILNFDGTHAGFSKFANLCSVHNIHVRVGCFCNIGACARYLNFKDKDIESNFQAGHTCGDNMDLLDGRPLGSIRLSFGYYNNKKDIRILIELLQKYYLNNQLMNFTKDCSPLISLKHIFIYPIKSCGAFSVTNWQVVSSGLLYDRQWLILQGNKILSQKSEPLLALIRPAINLKENTLSLSFDELGSRLIMPLLKKRQKFEMIACVGKVCNEVISGYDEGEDASLWLEECLGLTGLRLIKLASRGSMNNLSNSAEFLILNWSSLTDLTANSTLNKKNTTWMMNQFRANLIFESNFIYEERNWGRLIRRTVDDISFVYKDVCNRCKMLNIDQENADKSKEPMNTLSKIMESNIDFGILASCVLKDLSVNIEIGQEFDVISTSNLK